MKAYIEIDVPEWQIGQEVSVYFPDTMHKKAVCKLADINHEDFLDWLCCCVFEDEWEEYPEFYREVILRKLVRMGKVDLQGEDYILKPPKDEVKVVKSYYSYKERIKE